MNLHARLTPSLVAGLALMLSALPSRGAAAMSCPTTWGESGGYGSVALVTSSTMTTADLNSAFAAWLGCGTGADGYGRGFPRFSTNAASAGIQVDVISHGGVGDNCGQTQPLEAVGQFIIELWEKSRTGTTEFLCNQADTLGHELGHVLGLGDDPCWHSDGLMAPAALAYNPTTGLWSAVPRSVSGDECSFANDRWVTRFETGTPGPQGLPGPIDASDTPTCPGGEGCSPILLDLGRHGIHISSQAEGVLFDLNSNCVLDFVSWPIDHQRVGFLWLDRNGNGSVDGGAELFGDSSPQPPSVSPNGFRALRVFDNLTMGGNRDGIISEVDSVYRELRLWIDGAPRNGLLDKGEVLDLRSARVSWIGLAYDDRREIDENGNIFRWHGEFGRPDGTSGNAVDVLFVGDPLGETCSIPR